MNKAHDWIQTHLAKALVSSWDDWEKETKDNFRSFKGFLKEIGKPFAPLDKEKAVDISNVEFVRSLCYAAICICPLD